MTKFRSAIRGLIFSCCAVSISLCINSFFLEVAQVEGNSMENTLKDGERLIINKLGYAFTQPERGDLIVVKGKKEIVTRSNILFAGQPADTPSQEPVSEVFYIKRIIAIPGDTVEIRDFEIYLNNKKLDEPYKIGPTNKKSWDTAVTLPPGKFFLLGDNRVSSRDSRSFGLLDINQITGKAVFRIWPLDKAGPVQ